MQVALNCDHMMAMHEDLVIARHMLMVYFLQSQAVGVDIQQGNTKALGVVMVSPMVFKDVLQSILRLCGVVEDIDHSHIGLQGRQTIAILAMLGLGDGLDAADFAAEYASYGDLLKMEPNERLDSIVRSMCAVNKATLESEKRIAAEHHIYAVLTNFLFRKIEADPHAMFGLGPKDYEAMQSIFLHRVFAPGATQTLAATLKEWATRPF
jgi:hypothetical protein